MAVDTKSSIKQFFSLGQAGTDWVLANLTYLFFLVFLVLIYIANAHYSESKIRKIHLLTNEVNELRFEYMSLRSQIMYETKQSKIAAQVKELGLQRSDDKVFVIED